MSNIEIGDDVAEVTYYKNNYYFVQLKSNAEK